MKQASKRPAGRGRPRIDSRRQSVTIRLKPEQQAKLDAVAEKKGTTRSAIMQIAVAEYLDKES